MARVILLTDFGEEYAKDLLKGIVAYSREHEPWVLCKMPLSYKDLHGIAGVLEWAKEWKADAIIGQFYNSDPVELFTQNNIIVLAQDFKERFDNIPNITGDHLRAGEIAAQYFMERGYRNYAFFGIQNAVWSMERCDGMRNKLNETLTKPIFHEYHRETKDGLWYYEEELKLWLEHLPKPIAIMACDDNQARHIAEICSLQGIKIPDDIALLGVDNDETVCLLSSPSLSSLNQAIVKGGYQTAQLIAKLIEDPHYEWNDIIVQPTHITTRDSTDIFSTKDAYVASVIKYIHQNIDQKMTVQELVKLVPLSRKLLEVRFKNETSYSIYAYILNLRIEKMAKQLIETDKPIINISLELGNIDYKNLSRQFRNQKGCTPTEYRYANKIEL